MAYYSLAPLGEERGDFQAALISYVVSRAAGGKTSLADFLLDFNPPQSAPKLTPQEAAAHDEVLLARFVGPRREEG